MRTPSRLVPATAAMKDTQNEFPASMRNCQYRYAPIIAIAACEKFRTAEPR